MKVVDALIYLASFAVFGALELFVIAIVSIPVAMVILFIFHWHGPVSVQTASLSYWIAVTLVSGVQLARYIVHMHRKESP